MPRALASGAMMRMRRLGAPGASPPCSSACRPRICASHLLRFLRSMADTRESLFSFRETIASSRRFASAAPSSPPKRSFQLRTHSSAASVEGSSRSARRSSFRSEILATTALKTSREATAGAELEPGCSSIQLHRSCARAPSFSRRPIVCSAASKSCELASAAAPRSALRFTSVAELGDAGIRSSATAPAEPTRASRKTGCASSCDRPCHGSGSISVGSSRTSSLWSSWADSMTLQSALSRIMRRRRCISATSLARRSADSPIGADPSPLPACGALSEQAVTPVLSRLRTSISLPPKFA
mmetsp:Transcript_15230/g.39246  ORF Transcript_15230/g.39246 Transcript_15230/m.39246 type:complete len:299 (-) Transcript_15230:957-1853(-)